MDKVNLRDKLALFADHWSPRIVGEVNDSHIKLVKVQGEFTWHHHENEDELFLVLQGSLTIKLRDRDILVNEGNSSWYPGAWSTSPSPSRRPTSFSWSRNPSPVTRVTYKMS